MEKPTKSTLTGAEEPNPPAPDASQGFSDRAAGGKSFWRSLGGAREAIGKFGGTADRLWKATVENAHKATRSTGAAAVKLRQETAQPFLETGHKAMDTLKDTVDPAAVGGAVAGMSAGEVVGAAIGGVLGSLAGPAGALIGAEAGGFAGLSIGAKLGYDVTHEAFHPEDADADLSLKGRMEALPELLGRKAGDNAGGKAGVVGGAAIGGVLAGPAGAMVGAAVGEAIAGELGESGAFHLYRKAKQQVNGHPQVEADGGEAKEWLAESAKRAVGEAGTEAAIGALGSMVAGPLGERIGLRVGAITATHMDWSLHAKAESSAAQEMDTQKENPVEPQ